ncbi:vanadium-dependent haloperoxidase [Pseudoxanthomonas sp. UTMC 1351]|uniref:vanadium-dependent haloperoxidase n=1 Tax=Pseudoxanthomonas sp. UTMC 1351 TaxID=2695853 RepID=UPI0034CE3437
MNTSIISRGAFGRVLSLAALILAALAVPPAMASDAADVAPDSRQNAVVHWNTIADQAFAPSQGTNPMAQSRTLAILHASIHDALNAIDRRYTPYTPGLTAAPTASADAAVATAAREVLVSLLPDQAALVQTAYDQAIAAVPDSAARNAGVDLGRAAAWATMRRRHGDGADTAAQPVYVPGSGPGEYQFTAPFDFSAQPSWGRMQPFVIDLRDHSTQGPLTLTSAQYAHDLAYVKKIGHAASKTRTPEQSEIAKFWYEDSPLGWNRIANAVVRQRGLDSWEAARAFTLVNFAMADGFIAGFNAKYKHRFWRPVTAIHAADSDGNPRTVADATWQPFMTTPPVPDYPSTHTVLGWAAAEVLIDLFGDKERYAMTSATLPGVTRQYQGFSQAAQENGLSRLYAGIHFPHAVKHGRRQGRSVGQVVARALAPVSSRRHVADAHNSVVGSSP